MIQYQSFNPSLMLNLDIIMFPALFQFSSSVISQSFSFSSKVLDLQQAVDKDYLMELSGHQMLLRRLQAKEPSRLKPGNI